MSDYIKREAERRWTEGKMRLIDADALERQTITIENEWHMHEDVEIVNGSDIDNAPTIDPVRHGRWIGKTDGDGDEAYTCSECGEELYWLANYCPNCGAKMDGGEE